ncbi:type I restriction enzyme HsdR N-terminal domain-containing protein [Vibrio parahaemolyticus]|uniref:type I restriction enzyme HsdR N-terminal domain-containing protein n=1 Tax=Vibrio parahaemolyticus TaxID=670 RepID=UPI001A908D83|nr:type I restriction enzyme HsdR N-terminal domain-containing protein [Vibrio parahaemolyticus]MBO0180063.1 type I restriction enzyme HsdR N-terminal domain-containing protein [Vibrio parahaemolyticus]
MFSDFDFDVLNDPEFQEDAVREELILPIIRNLGYKISGDNRVVRSRSLINPLVAIGSKQRKVSIIPDYLFLADDKPFWVLDAKAPSEQLTRSKHVEQAYSYAIHPEVRAQYYALYNGEEFVLYQVSKFEPILQFKLKEISKHWELLFRLLNADVKANPALVEYHPDFGVSMVKLGAIQGFRFIGPLVNSKFIARVEDGLYTTTSVVEGDVECAISMDFNQQQLEELLSYQSPEIAELTRNSLKRMPYYVMLEGDKEFKFGVVAVLSDQVQQNAEESYIPFEVQEFMPYGGLPKAIK